MALTVPLERGGPRASRKEHGSMNEVSRDDQLASAVCAALLVALVTSCGGPSGPVGGVTLELRASSAVTIDSVAYDVSGNGFHKTGSIDVAHSTVIRASIGDRKSVV